MMIEVSKPAARIHVARLFLLIFNKLTNELIGKSFCYNPCLRMIRNKVTSSFALCDEINSCKITFWDVCPLAWKKPLLTQKVHVRRP